MPSGPRITGGSLRGRPLPGSPRRSSDLRPTGGRVREAIFSILGAAIVGAEALDLYAGTGLMGIEALSRGAARATFIEAARPRCALLSRNLDALGLATRSSVICGALPGALTRYAAKATLVFIDPPYADTSAEIVLPMLRPHLDSGAAVVYEHASRYNPPERPAGLALAERRVYGDSAVALYYVAENE